MSAGDTITVDGVVLLVVAGATPLDVRGRAYSLDDDIFFKWDIHYLSLLSLSLSLPITAKAVVKIPNITPTAKDNKQ